MLAYTFKTYSAPTGPNKKLSHVWPDNFWAISLVLQLTADSNPPTSYHHIITRLHQGWTNKGLNRGTELCLHFISSAFLFLFLCLLFTLFMLLFAIAADNRCVALFAHQRIIFTIFSVVDFPRWKYTFFKNSKKFV